MYDWNGNGKHDSFDDAMFMALLEDDLERHPPGKKTYRSSSSSSSEGSMGCMLYFAFLIFFPLYAAFEFLLMGEGGIAVGIIVLGVLLNIAAFCFMGSSTSVSEENKTAPKNSTVNTGQQTKAAEIKSSESVQSLFRYDNYDIVPERGGITIKKFVGVDKAVLEVPARLNNTPVCVIDTNAFYKCRYIEKLILPDGLNEIRDNIFNGCDNLKEVVIPKSVTKIGQDAFPHNKGIVLYCYGNSYGLEFARKNGFEYKDAEKTVVSVQEAKAEPKSEPEVKVESKPVLKSEPKSLSVSSVSAQKQRSHSYKSDYIPVYTPSYTSSSILDDEPEETVRERLDYDLIGTGYDSYDLEWMDEDERNQVLEDNFLDPYDYDFDDLD